MNEVLQVVGNALVLVMKTVVGSLIHNWFPLLLATVISSIMRTYIDAERLKTTLLNKPKVSILASVAFGAFTPLCACGTMAVIIGMLTTTLPWGPVMAFLTSSPLMSPDGFVMIAGVLNLRFAIGLTVASVMIGLGSGFVTHIIEKRTTYLKNQTRFAGKAEVKACGCGEGARETANTVLSAEKTCGCGTQTDKKEQKQRYKSAKTAVYRKKESKPQSVLEPVLCCASGMALSSSGLGTYARRKASSSKSLFDKSKSFLSAIKWKELLKGCYEIGVKQIILYFAIFVGIGSLINMLVPSSIIGALLGAHNIGAVPLATLIGLPLYITTDSAIPIIKSLIQSGASEGAMMAFMIAGSATSAWVIAGISAFLKKRAIALYLAFIIVGAIISGYVYDLVLTVL